MSREEGLPPRGAATDIAHWGLRGREEATEARLGCRTPHGAKRKRAASPRPALCSGAVSQSPKSVPTRGGGAERARPSNPPPSPAQLPWSLFFLPTHEMLREDAEPRGRGPGTYLRLRFPLPEAGGIARVPAAFAGPGGPGIRCLAAAEAELPARQLEGRGRRYLGWLPPSGPHPPGSRGLQSYSFPRCQRNFSSK